MRRRNIIRILCLALTFLLAEVVCRGQSNYAGVNGTVFDLRQQVVPGASLRLTSLSTETTRHVVSNEDGMYQITGLLPGDYKLAAEATGFALWTRTLNLEVGQQMKCDVTLTLSSVSSVVQVENQAAVLRTSDASVREVVEPTSIRNLPLNGRMLIDLVLTTPGSHENSAQSWYQAGYVNVRRRFARGWTFLANYTYSKNLSDAPDFRSPMFESAAPQNNSNLITEKGPACDIRHRFALSTVYAVPSLGKSGFANLLTKDWRLSAIYQAQSGFPFTISVFGDTANAGTLLGENPIRANYTGLPVFGPGTRTDDLWFNPAAFATPAAFTFGNVGRNTVYGPGRQTLDLALQREFSVTEQFRFQVRAEAFNALNHSNLGTPNRFVNTPQFGTITEAATPGREIQFGVRLSF